LRIVSDRHAPDIPHVPPPPTATTTTGAAPTATATPVAVPTSSTSDVRSKRTTPARVAASALKSSPAAPFADLSAIIADLLVRGPYDALVLEQTLADLIRAAREDRAALRAALDPIADRGLPPGLRHDLPLATPLRQLHALTLNIAYCPATARPRSQRFELSRLLERLSLPLDRPPGMDPYALRGPADILTLRLSELAARIGDPSAVELVSTPTHPSGWIDPEVLCARIAEAEEAGWQPWPVDLDQALLRLPESANAETVRAAHRLASPAGHRLAGWLRGGRPALPAVAAAVDREDPNRHPHGARIEPLTTFPAPIAAPNIPATLIHLVRRGWYAPLPLADGSCWTVCWPTLLPNHPDLIAAATMEHAQPSGVHGGTCRPGTLAPIARAITSRSQAERSGGAQALAALAASGHLDGDDFGRTLVEYATRSDRQVLRSAVPALRHALSASSAPPVREIGTTTAAAHSIATAILQWLPAVLPPATPQPLPYTSHLLNLAADALAIARTSVSPAATKAPATALVALTARPTRSAVSDAAQRLLAAITE
jgi:hypothetical protein